MVIHESADLLRQVRLSDHLANIYVMDLFTTLDLLGSQFVVLADAKATIQHNAQEVDGLLFVTDSSTSIEHNMRESMRMVHLRLELDNFEYRQHLINVVVGEAAERLAICDQDLEYPLDLRAVDVVR